jgi:hypothetical protein
VNQAYGLTPEEVDLSGRLLLLECPYLRPLIKAFEA